MVHNTLCHTNCKQFHCWPESWHATPELTHLTVPLTCTPNTHKDNETALFSYCALAMHIKTKGIRTTRMEAVIWRHVLRCVSTVDWHMCNFSQIIIQITTAYSDIHRRGNALACWGAVYPYPRHTLRRLGLLLSCSATSRRWVGGDHEQKKFDLTFWTLPRLRGGSSYVHN